MINPFFMLGVDALRVQEFETKYSLGYNESDYFSPENRYVIQLQSDHDEFEKSLAPKVDVL